MTPTETLPPTAPKVDTGLTDSTYSSSTSSSSAERYSLSETDERPILLYNYRAAKDKLKTSSQKDLCALLDKGVSSSSSPSSASSSASILTDRPDITDERLRVTRKPIPRMTSYVDVKRHDLFLPEERTQYHSLPNYDSSLASVKLPASAYLQRMLSLGYDQLYIISPEASPNASLADIDSRRTTPSSTWGLNSETMPTVAEH